MHKEKNAQEKLLTKGRTKEGRNTLTRYDASPMGKRRPLISMCPLPRHTHPCCRNSAAYIYTITCSMVETKIRRADRL